MLRRILPALVLLTLPVVQAQAPPPAVQEATLLPTPPADIILFGAELDYDGARAVVGSPSSAVNGSFSGAAFVYERTGTEWVQMAQILSPTPEPFESFANSVAIAGDRMVIGAPGEDPDRPGAAFVYAYDGTVWQQTARLFETLSDVEDEQYGATVEMDGDRIYVGAPSETIDGQPNDRGVVYVYLFDGAGWVLEARLTPAPVTDRSSVRFGKAISASGDRLLIGASGGEFGDAFVFHRTAAGWSQEARLGAGASQRFASFGFSVSLDGDRALVGAPSETRAFEAEGSAYVFERTGDTWAQTAQLTATSGPTGQLGQSTALSGSVAVVGAPGVESNTGRAYGFELTGSEWVQREVLFADEREAGDRFGSSVGYADGRALIGAVGYSASQGAVFVFGSLFVGAEDGPLADGAALSAPAPNPSRGAARLTLTLDAPEAVRTVLMDALGREVAVLQDGVAVGETEITVDTSVLPTGVYVVRVTGDSVSATRRLTVVR